jgi:hypothetical protein
MDVSKDKGDIAGDGDNILFGQEAEQDDYETAYIIVRMDVGGQASSYYETSCLEANPSFTV